MYRKGWYYELKGTAAYWVAALLFILIGGAFTAVGVKAKVFLIIGIPFLCLGALVPILLIYSLYLKLTHPENYKTWLWWMDFIGGLVSALTFAIPSVLALPILLLLKMNDEALLIGAVFSVVGLVVMIGVWFVARKQYRERPMCGERNLETRKEVKIGAWGVEPWESDGAADWFADMFGDLKIEMMREALKYYDAYDEIRAACYVLQTLGRVYVWPAARHDDLKELLDKGIKLLTNMLNPPSADWDFLELWGRDPKVIASVQKQLDELKARRSKIL